MPVGDGLQPGTEMGPLVTADHRKRVIGYIDKGVAEGAHLLCDGREMALAREEIFGPVLSVIRVETIEDAIGLVNSSRFGNTTSIFTRTARRRACTARKSKWGWWG